MAEEDAADMAEPERQATQDMGEHLRTWRFFISFMRWHVVVLGLLLLGLLAFRTHG